MPPREIHQLYTKIVWNKRGIYTGKKILDSSSMNGLCNFEKVVKVTPHWSKQPRSTVLYMCTTNKYSKIYKIIPFSIGEDYNWCQIVCFFSCWLDTDVLF